jgi:hypothetical protein
VGEGFKNLTTEVTEDAEETIQKRLKIKVRRRPFYLRAVFFVGARLYGKALSIVDAAGI